VKKLLLRLLFFLALLLIVIAVAWGIKRNSFASERVRELIEKNCECDITIGGIHVGFFANSVVIEEIRFMEPQSEGSTNAGSAIISLADIRLKTNPLSLLGPVKTISSLEVTVPELHIKRIGEQTNLDCLGPRVAELLPPPMMSLSLPGSKATAKAAEKPSSKPTEDASSSKANPPGAKKNRVHSSLIIQNLQLKLGMVSFDDRTPKGQIITRVQELQLNDEFNYTNMSSEKELKEALEADLKARMSAIL